MPNSHPTTATLASGGVLDLIASSGPVAKLVLLVLLAASVFCWALILMKWRSLSRAHSQNQKFLTVFWNGKTIEEIFAKCESYPSSPVATVFKSGFKELKKVNANEADTDTPGKV